MEFIRSFDKLAASIIGKLPNWVRPLMVGITSIGSPLVTTVSFLLVMVVTFQQRNYNLLIKEAIILAVIPLGGIIKLLTRRARPETIYVERMLFKTYSFPSGHAYGSFLVFGFMAALIFHSMNSQWAGLITGLLVSLIVLVGISRVYLGAHFPSDVTGAWLIGGFVLALFLKFT